MTAVSGQAESERRRRREFTEWRERETQREQAAADPVRMRSSMGLAGRQRSRWRTSSGRSGRLRRAWRRLTSARG
ncbi:hypothetical protein C5C04_11310 [Rathayibacter rathayi]|uniref:Uncharacterized protein n=1 Tax=Rathayibacter rathayi TaxID=33887 RepID=A0ABD6W6H8_RATRA|nr:hypothetical protein C5C04_11310 [Rathayibacter rathayi]